MALDPSIILANADPSRQYDPVASMMKAQSLRAAMNQNQIQQQQMQDTADFRNQYGVSPGVAQAAQKMQLGNLENVKAQHEAAKADLEALNAFKDQQWQTYSKANPDNWPQVKAEALANAQAFAQKTGRPLPANAGASDEDVFDPVKQKQRMDGLLSFDRQLKLAEQALATRKQDFAETEHAKSDFGKFAADMGLAPTDPQAMKLYLQAHPRASMGMVQVGGGMPSTDPAKRSPRAQMIADGLVPVPKPTRGDPNALRDTADAQQIMLDRGEDPAVLPGKFESAKQGQLSFSAGKPNARIITAINTASDHTENILKPAMEALRNGDWVTANKLGNAIGVNLGKNEATNFDSVATFLATEIAKVASGGGQPTIAEIAEARKMFPTNGSNAQIGGAIDIANRIMGGKLSALDIEHKNAFGGKSILDMKRLSPEAIKNVADAHGAGPSGSPKPGTVMDGYVFNGGDPKDPKSWKKL
jgi:hypothetical protein